MAVAGYSDKIDPVQVLYALGDDYTITRLSHVWPHYVAGSDVDIIVKNADVAASAIVHRLTRDGVRGADGIGYADSHIAGGHTHVDLTINGAIDLRFDLIDSIPWRLPVDPDLLYHAIGNSHMYVGARVPDDSYECVLRMLEWAAMGAGQPYKSRHRDWAVAHWTPDASAVWTKYCAMDCPVEGLVDL